MFDFNPEADVRSMQLGLTASMPSTVSTREPMAYSEDTSRSSRTSSSTTSVVGFREGVGSARAVSIVTYGLVDRHRFAYPL